MDLLEPVTDNPTWEEALDFLQQALRQFAREACIVGGLVGKPTPIQIMRREDNKPLRFVRGEQRSLFRKHYRYLIEYRDRLHDLILKAEAYGPEATSPEARDAWLKDRIGAVVEDMEALALETNLDLDLDQVQAYFPKEDTTYIQDERKTADGSQPDVIHEGPLLDAKAIGLNSSSTQNSKVAALLFSGNKTFTPVSSTHPHKCLFESVVGTALNTPKKFTADGFGNAIAVHKTSHKTEIKLSIIDIADQLGEEDRSPRLLPWQGAKEILDRFGAETIALHLILSAYTVGDTAVELSGLDLCRLMGYDKSNDVSNSGQLKRLKGQLDALGSIAVAIKYTHATEARKNKTGVVIPHTIRDTKFWNLTTDVKYDQNYVYKQISLLDGEFEAADDPPITEIRVKVRPGGWVTPFTGSYNTKDIAEGTEQFSYLCRELLDLNVYQNRTAFLLGVYMGTYGVRIMTPDQYWTVGGVLEKFTDNDRLQACANQGNEASQKRRDLLNEWITSLTTLESIGFQIKYHANYPDYLKPGWQGKQRPRGYWDDFMVAKLRIEPREDTQAQIERVKARAAKPRAINPARKKALSAAKNSRPAIAAWELKEAMDAKGYTQGRLAGMLAVDRTIVSRWCSGKRDIPDHIVPSLKKILDLN